MTLDHERQRALLLEILKVCQFPGAAIDELFALKRAIVAAPVTPVADTATGTAVTPSATRPDAR